MGGGRNGCFWRAPVFASFCGQSSIFCGFGQNRGTPKTAVPTTTHPIPHLTPSDQWTPGSIAVEGAVENRGLYRAVASRFLRGFDTIAPKSGG